MVEARVPAGNFEVMREGNHAEVYRRALVLFAQRLMETQRAFGDPKADLPATTREAKIKVESFCAS